MNVLTILKHFSSLCEKNAYVRWHHSYFDNGFEFNNFSVAYYKELYVNKYTSLIYHVCEDYFALY